MTDFDSVRCTCVKHRGWLTYLRTKTGKREEKSAIVNEDSKAIRLGIDGLVIADCTQSQEEYMSMRLWKVGEGDVILLLPLAFRCHVKQNCTLELRSIN